VIKNIRGLKQKMDDELLTKLGIAMAAEAYNCPKHGTIDKTISFYFPDIGADGTYCALCVAKIVHENLLEVRKPSDESEGIRIPLRIRKRIVCRKLIVPVYLQEVYLEDGPEGAGFYLDTIEVEYEPDDQNPDVNKFVQAKRSLTRSSVSNQSPGRLFFAKLKKRMKE
jgi:hypothetical protein